MPKVPIDSLSQDPSNKRRHDAKNLDAIKASLRRFGQQTPIVVNAEGVILKGNGTHAAAKALGWEEIDAVESDLEGREAAAYAVADNRSGELASWEERELAQFLEEMHNLGELEATGFDEEDLDSLNEKIEAEQQVEAKEIEETEAPPLPDEPTSKQGQMWALGDHRLICGDCREPETWALLMDGESANVVVTSPPYASQRKYDETSGFKPIPPDAYGDWFEPLQALIAQHLAPDGSFFLNIKEHTEDGQRHLYVKDLTLRHVREWGWLFVDELCWVKPDPFPGSFTNRFKCAFEPIFHFARVSAIKFRPDSVKVQSDRAFDYAPGRGSGRASGNVGFMDEPEVRSGTSRPSNVLNCSVRNVPNGSEHSAAYPVQIPDFFVRAFSDEGDVIVDPFLGSGTTLMAADARSRRCFGMEISARHCDVIIRRWEEATGGEAKLLEACSDA